MIFFQVSNSFIPIDRLYFLHEFGYSGEQGAFIRHDIDKLLSYIHIHNGFTFIPQYL